MGSGAARPSLIPDLAQYAESQITNLCAAVVYCGDDSMEVEYEYPHQKSLGYGADWSYQKNLPVIASVSFYDKLLHIWRQNRQKLAT